MSGSLEKYKTYLVVVAHEKTIVQPYLEINKIGKQTVKMINSWRSAAKAAAFK